MSESHDYLEIAFKAIELFANDGRLDASELKLLVSIAERDGVIDQNEIRVLRNIVSKIQPHEVDEPMRQELERLSGLIGSQSI